MTRVGASGAFRTPSPRAPSEEAPQQYTSPDPVSAHPWVRPTPTATGDGTSTNACPLRGCFVAGLPSCPNWFMPQHASFSPEILQPK
jgi:hypothetical protein